MEKAGNIASFTNLIDYIVYTQTQHTRDCLCTNCTFSSGKAASVSHQFGYGSVSVREAGLARVVERETCGHPRRGHCVSVALDTGVN